MNPLVSVIITTYNQVEYLAETIASALNQTYRHREVIVVDDGSTDDTPACLARFEGSIVHVRQENQGVAGSRNTGVRHARGELLAFLDGDDIWEPEKIAMQVAAYQAHPRAGLIAVNACVFSGSEILRKSALPQRANALLMSADGEVFTGPVYRELLEGNFIGTTSQVMIPARILEEVGPSDGRFRIASDYDLYLRIAAAYDLSFVKRTLVRWRYLSTSASGPADLRLLRWLHNEVAVLKKHLGSAPPELRSVIRRTVHDKTFQAAQMAYDYGCDVDSGWAGRYLRRLWTLNPTDVRPLMFSLGLWSPAAFRRSGSALLRTLFGMRSR